MSGSTGGTYRVVSAHTGAEFESGECDRRRGRYEPNPGVEPEPAGSLDSDQQQQFGRQGTGLDTHEHNPNKKRAPARTMPARMGPVWATVTVTDRHYETNPKVVCKDCSKVFSGGVTRVVDHIINFKDCSCSTQELEELKAKLIKEREDKSLNKEKKAAVREVQAKVEAAESKPKPMMQRGIEAAMQSGQDTALDEKIAELVYGDNLPFTFAESPRFKAVIQAAKVAPLSYKPPDARSLGGSLLEKTVGNLKAAEKPLRAASTKFGCTVVSDGWDDCEHSHLINFLVATNQGAFFDGTVKLGADDHEDAQAVADHLIKEIEHVGQLSVVQVVTDTCAVMNEGCMENRGGKVSLDHVHLLCSTCPLAFSQRYREDSRSGSSPLEGKKGS